MKQAKFYQYSSNYGTVLTTVNLEFGIPKIVYHLIAEKGKILTNGITRVSSVEVDTNELKLWKEVERTQEELQEEKQYYDEITNNETNNYKQLLDIITGEREEET